MFSGVNFASGGAPQEYGEALSAVLPLETKDYSKVDKVGVNASVVGVGGGGTKTLDRGSLSVDLNYQNLSLYDKVYSGRTEFRTALPDVFRCHPVPSYPRRCERYGRFTRNTTGRTFPLTKGMNRRLFALAEDNIYVNATFR